jgi:adenosylcobinamide kinase/adenosylcobinamide-phosphate guanylyltransferase
MTTPDLTFVLGGARSGKSAYAEGLAGASGRPVTYIATARGADPEFAARIAHHRARRPAHWNLVEAGAALDEALRTADGDDVCLLVDCLTLWLAGLLCPPETCGPALNDADADSRIDALLAALADARARVIVVSNEIGLGVVPLGSVTRRYVDTLGRLNQRMAALAPEVLLMVAGLPLAVKTASRRT